MSTPEPDSSAPSSRDIPAVVGDWPLLSQIPAELRPLIINSFEPVSYQFGEEIIHEGDPGESMYIIASGTVRVLKLGEGGVAVSLNKLGPGKTFGELALVSDSPCIATVQASEEVEAYRLHGAVFRGILRTVPEVRKQIEIYADRYQLGNFLRTRSAFGGLSDEALVALLLALKPVAIPAGQTVVKQGGDSGSLYIVREGRLAVYKDTDGQRETVNYLRDGDFFGEVSLLSGSAPIATVETTADTQLLELNPEAFQELLDTYPAFRTRVEERVRQYEYLQVAQVPLDFAEEVLPTEVEFAAPDEHELTAAQRPEGAEEEELPEDLKEFFPTTRKKILRFPHLWQIDELDCGATALAIVAKYYGHIVSRMKIRRTVGTTSSGTNLFGMIEGSRQLGFRSRALKTSRENLDKLPLPVIGQWDSNHWVVVYRVSKRRVWVSDPGLGKRSYSRAQFNERWSGYTVLLSPTAELERQPRHEPTRWMLDLLAPRRGALIRAAILALVVAGLQMLVPVATSFIVNDVLKAGHHRPSLLPIIVLAIFGVLLTAFAASLFQQFILSKTAVRFNRDTLRFVTWKLLALPFSFFATRRSSDLTRRLNNLETVREAIIADVPQALMAFATLSIALVEMFIFNQVLAAIFVATLPIYIGLLRFSASRLRPLYDTVEDAWATFSSRQGDAVKSIDMVKSMAAERGTANSMLREFDRLSPQILRADLTLLIYGTIVNFSTYVMLGFYLWLGALEVLHHGFSVGAFVAFNALVLLAQSPIQTLLSFWEHAQYSRVMLNRINDMIDQEPEQGSDHSHLQPVKSLGGEIEFANVGFAYPGPRPIPILSDINLKVSPGENIAIVGRSGAGKTTLVKCLTGMLEPTEGKVLFDGIDLTTLKYRELRRHVGYVLQDSAIFEDTIARNIAFGEEKPELDRVIWAAKMADAHDFINRLPLGYETKIGATGLGLSGGQTQRIAIARAIHNRPPVLILDEATSALDVEAEKAVQQNMTQLLKGRTTFVIAHRLSTVRDADKIIVIERGRIVEAGTHDELMRHEGLYFYLTSQQLDL